MKKLNTLRVNSDFFFSGRGARVPRVRGPDWEGEDGEGDAARCRGAFPRKSWWTILVGALRCEVGRRLSGRRGGFRR